MSMAHINSERARRIAPAVAMWVAVVAWPATGRTQDSDYCRKVRARAGGDAALLFAPTIQVQGLKFPNNGTVDTGITTGAGYQFRAGLTFSPLDFYKGFRVLRAGAADCAQHEAVASAQELLLQAEDVGRAPALRKQAEFLDARRAAWQGVVVKSDERLAARVTPLVETLAIRSRASELERKRVQVGGELERLVARGLAGPTAAPAALADAVDRSAMRYEREASHLRTLDAWNVGFSGGLIPQSGYVDYFAMLTVSFNLGGAARYGREQRYLAARSAELLNARYEVRDQARRLTARLASARAQAERELAIIDEQLASLTASRDALEHADAPNAPHALALVSLELIGLESDRVFLTALAGELSRLQENDHGR